jgi:hypothetical protein
MNSRERQRQPVMTVVTTGLSVSLDGFIAGADDGPGLPLGAGGTLLFDWYTAGDTASEFYRIFTCRRRVPPSSTTAGAAAGPS